MTTKDIRFVKQLINPDGFTYEWFVSYKPHCTYGAMYYITEDDNGRTAYDVNYEKEWLPKYVQRFIDTHTKRLFYQGRDEETNEITYTHYIYD